MPRPTGAIARRAAACLVAAIALAGCAGGSTGASSITATGQTLDIYISEPANIAADPVEQDVVDAEKLAYHAQSSEVKDYGLQLIVIRRPTLSDNARAAIQDKSAIAYLGELAPGSTEQTAGIMNALDLLTVSPTDNALELTQATAAIANAPDHYYESLSTLGHTFARVVPSSYKEASFAVSLIKALGAASVYVGDDGSDYGRAIARALRSAASSGSVTVASSESGAGAIFYGGTSPTAAAGFFNAAASTDPAAKLLAPSALDSPAFTAALSAAARAHMYITTPGIPPSAETAAGRTFISTFKADHGHAPSVEAIFGYEAMTDTLDAILNSGSAGDKRGTVIKSLFKLKDPARSVLPGYSFDSSGDTSLADFVYIAPGGAVHALPSSTAG